MLLASTPENDSTDTENAELEKERRMRSYGFKFEQYMVSGKLYNCLKCTAGKKKGNTPIYFNTNYRTEMKLKPIIMNYCLL